jgi:hypothetical protein
MLSICINIKTVTGKARTTRTVTIGPSTAESRAPFVLATWVITSYPAPVT